YTNGGTVSGGNGGFGGGISSGGFGAGGGATSNNGFPGNRGGLPRHSLRGGSGVRASFFFYGHGGFGGGGFWARGRGGCRGGGARAKAGAAGVGGNPGLVRISYKSWRLQNLLAVGVPKFGKYIRNIYSRWAMADCRFFFPAPRPFAEYRHNR